MLPPSSAMDSSGRTYPDGSSVVTSDVVEQSPSETSRRDHMAGQEAPQTQSQPHPSPMPAIALPSHASQFSPSIPHHFEVSPSLPENRDRNEQVEGSTSLSTAPATETTQAEGLRVYIACLECRSRKVRCDGGRPSCKGCTRRQSSCRYDTEPKRRGPDKVPGRRQRAPKGANTGLPKKRRESLTSTTESAAPKRKRPSSGDNQDIDRAKTPPLVEQAVAKKRRSSRTSVGNPQPGPDLTGLRPASIPVLDAISAVRSPSVAQHPNEAPPLPSAVPKLMSQLSSSSLLSRGYSRPHIAATEHNDGYIYNLSFDVSHIGASQTGASSSRFSAGSQAIPTKQEDQSDYRQRSAPLGYLDIIREPSLKFSRANWWDTLLSVYGPDRRLAAKGISDDLATLFRTATVSLAFINVPLFYSTLLSPESRASIQPSLVLGLLAYSTLTQSSEVELGAPGRMKAVRLQEYAHAAFAASYNSGWIDTTLAQAAWIITHFEYCAHPHYSFSRSMSSTHLLDNVLCVLRLPCLDVDNPSAPVFIKHSVPALPSSRVARSASSHLPMNLPPSHPPQHAAPQYGAKQWVPSSIGGYSQAHAQSSASMTTPSVIEPSKGCPCASLALINNSEAHRITPWWLMSPNWEPSWSFAEIRREESRRVVWASLTLVSGFVAARLGGALSIPDLYVTRPENYALLFSGEALYPYSPLASSGFSGKESAWALSSRAMLLWNTCIRVQGDASLAPETKAEFAKQAWLETIAIEDAFNEHTCFVERATLYYGRENLLNTRMYISFEFRRTIPFPWTGINFAQFNRNKALELLMLQKEVATQMTIAPDDAPGPSGNIITKPFYIWWFMGQAGRYLRLWRMDPSLSMALDVALQFLPLIDYLAALYPCPEQLRLMALLRAGLTAACQFAGKPAPGPTSLSLVVPPIIR